jgi:hypothetical protein
MILLVVGLVAVIVVIVIAVFLSIRLGRSDEHDDEPDITSSSHDQWAEEDHWREPSAPGARRSPQPARAGRGARTRDGSRDGSRDDDRGHSGDPAYSGAHGRDHAGSSRNQGYADGPPRRTRRDPSEHQSSSPRRRSMVPASAESRGRYDTRASRQAPADDYPSADYPSMDFPPGEYAAADYPAAGYPDDAGRPDSRRSATPAPASGKSRSRQHRGKRADADDWPTTEWDKLSDEQYWAELSADKPLATMARPAQSASPDREQGRGQRSRSERPPQREAVTGHPSCAKAACGQPSRSGRNAPVAGHRAIPRAGWWPSSIPRRRIPRLGHQPPSVPGRRAAPGT